LDLELEQLLAALEHVLGLEDLAAGIGLVSALNIASVPKDSLLNFD
jgi:hypothetical protein